MMPAMASSGQGSVSLNAQLLVDSIPALIHTARPDGYLDYFNKPWLEYLGVTLDKVTGWNWTAAVHPEDVEGIVAKWRACLATGEIFEYETRVRSANGEYRWMFHRKVPLRDANGNIVKWYGSSLDIEERKTAEEKLRRSERDLHSIIETIPTMVWSAAPDGSVDFFNPRWLDYTGLSPDQSRDWRWTAAIHPDDLSRLTDAWQSILVSGEPGETEARLRRFDDASYRWFLFRASPLRDESGKIVKWYGTNVDIEDRKRAEEELRRSEFYLSEGQRLAHMGSWVLDAAGCFPYWSHELFHIYGLDPAKEGPSFEEYLASIHPQDREFMRSLINRMIPEASGCDVTKQIVRPSGEVRYVRCVGVPIVENGTLKRIVGSAIDVTEHELLTQELRRREAYLTEAQRLSHTGSFGWRPETGEIVWSDETYRIFEYDRSVKPTIDSLAQRVHPEDRADFKEVTNRALAGATDFEHAYRLLLPDGRVKHVHAIAHVLQHASGNREFVGAVTDVSEQRNAEAVIRAQEAELRKVVDTIPAIVWSTLPDGSNTYVNRRFEEYSGSSAEQMAGSGWQALIHPDDLERHAGEWMEAVATGKPHEIEVRSRRSDGQYRWQLDRGVPLRDEDGHIVKWYGVTTDIEDRKRAEEALEVLSRDLQESEDRLEEAQRITHVGYWEWDLATNGITWSDETYRIHGLQPQERPMDLAAVREKIHPEDWNIVLRALEDALSSDALCDIECRVFRPTGEVRIIDSQGHVKRDTSGRPTLMFGTVQDITDRKRAEHERERLRQLEADLAHVNRVSTLGEMSASLAREIKQPIAAAVNSANSCIEWLAHEPPNLDRARAAAARIDKYGNRAAIDRIRSFYKKSPPRRELVDVNGIIEEILTLLKCEADRYSIAMRTELATELPKLMADRVQSQQVFMNLMLNGIEAMKDSGGELTVKSQLQDGQLQFSVSDTGVGLPPQKMDQIFSAFFTTKPQGSGMGLAISRSIVESHGDRLWATVNSGQGATFHFTLPTQGVGVITFGCVDFRAGRTRLWLVDRREDRRRRLSK